MYIHSTKKIRSPFGQIQGRVGKMTAYFSLYIIIYVYYVYKYTCINIYLHLCLFIYSIKKTSFLYGQIQGVGIMTAYFSLYIIIYVYYVYKYTCINIYLFLCLFIYSTKKIRSPFGLIQGRVGKMTAYFSLYIIIYVYYVYKYTCINIY
jgi:hypothetical protein